MIRLRFACVCLLRRHPPLVLCAREKVREDGVWKAHAPRRRESRASVRIILIVSVCMLLDVCVFVCVLHTYLLYAGSFYHSLFDCTHTQATKLEHHQHSDGRVINFNRNKSLIATLRRVVILWEIFHTLLWVEKTLLRRIKYKCLTYHGHSCDVWPIMYVCMYVCMHVCMYVCPTRIQTHIRIG